MAQRACTISFVASPFTTKAEYERWRSLDPAERSALRAAQESVDVTEAGGPSPPPQQPPPQPPPRQQQIVYPYRGRQEHIVAASAL